MLIRSEYHPGLDPVAIVVYTLVLAAIGAGLSLLRKHDVTGGAHDRRRDRLVAIGAWGGADLGDGSIVTSIIASLVPALLVGVRFGMTTDPDYTTRIDIDNRSRATIFVGPALLFIFVMLVVPAIRTGYLSLLDRDSDGVRRPRELRDRSSPTATASTLDNWTNMFTSIPFLIGVVLLVIAVFVGVR